MEVSQPFFDATSTRVVHGSADSIDLDVIYLSSAVSHRLPSGAEFSAFCAANVEEDVNFALLAAKYEGQDEVVVESCVRGLPSECNNMLFVTARGMLPVALVKVPRSSGEKLIDVLQKTTIMLRRSPSVREEAIACLRSNAVARMMKLISCADFELLDLSPNGTKQIAFMCAQWIALETSGKELYDKGSIITEFPFLRNVLHRQELDGGLQQIVRTMIEIIGKLSIYQSGDIIIVLAARERTVLRFKKNFTRCIAMVTDLRVKLVRWAQKEYVAFDPIDFRPNLKRMGIEANYSSSGSNRIILYYQDGSCIADLDVTN